MKFSIIKSIAQKDILLEYRSREALNSVIFFSLLVLAIASFALEPGSEAIKELSGGVLWISYFFSGMIILNRSFALEQDENAIQSLLLAPIKKSHIFWGKFVTNFIYIVFIEIIIFLIFIIFFNLQFHAKMIVLWLYIILIDAGFISVGTLFAAMLIRSKTREMLLPILLFPVSIPLVIASVKATSYLIQNVSYVYIIPYVKIIIAFDLIYVFAVSLLAEFVIGE